MATVEPEDLQQRNPTSQDPSVRRLRRQPAFTASAQSLVKASLIGAAVAGPSLAAIQSEM